MARLSRAEAREFEASVTRALEGAKLHAAEWEQATRAQRREAFSQLGAYHILKLARQLGIKAPSDPDARERFNYGDAVKKALGI
jgi:hypothetical protein